MFTRHLARGEQTRQYSIFDALEGWTLEKRENARTVRLVRFEDWHHVERAIAAIKDEVAELERDGWMLTARNGKPVPEA
jgi:hypothetical protein